MKFFADAYIPLSPVAPVSQLVLLVVIIIIEGMFIRKKLTGGVQGGSFWLRISGVNVFTTVLGLIGLLPVTAFESHLVFGWGSDSSHPLLWYTGCILYGFVIPWTVWLLCYQISWRTEFWLLNKLNTYPSTEKDSLRIAVRNAHRWSYAMLGVFVLVATSWYWLTIFHPLQ